MARFIFIFSLAQFIFFHSLSGQSWTKGSITGEGEVVKQEITLPSFDGVSMGFSGDVIIAQGATQKVVIEGQQNIIDNIKRDVEGGTWKINFIKNVKNAKNVTVYITIPKIDYVGLFGSGSIHSSGRFTGLNQMDLSLSGSGDIRMDFDAVATDLQISGSGEIELRGSSKTLEISISGSGDVSAQDLVTTKCDVHISGSGDASVHVNGDLGTQISGSGDVRYRGDANVTARISGSGTVSKL